jgi:lysyl-tRNA synthetase class 2
MNLLPKAILKKRSQFLHIVREYMYSNDFLEIDTNSLKKIPGMEPYLDPFIVHSPSGEEKGYLITSPEYSLKMVVSSGLEKIYEIAHVYRSGEKGSSIHSAEFLMLEMYAVGWDEFAMMDFCDSLFKSIHEKLEIDSSLGFQRENRFTNLEIFLKYTSRTWEREDLILTLNERSIPFHLEDAYEDLYFLVFLNCIEPFLPHGIVYLYDYPPECAALAKVELGVARRFEIYWDGVEIGNAFYELGDSTEQRKRFKKEQELRKKLNKEVFPLDEDFLSCLEMTFPEICTGISIGLDRVLMKITNSSSLKEISPYS